MESPINPRLETPRLILEPLAETHADELFPLLADARLYTFIPLDAPASIDALRTRYRKLATRFSPDGREQWLNWVMRARESHEALGLLEATVTPERAAQIAYLVFPAHWRQGYAREGCRRVIDHLFRDLAALNVFAEIDTRNVPSIRLVESLGLLQVAFTPGADTFKGSVSDEYRFERRNVAHPDGPTRP